MKTKAFLKYILSLTLTLLLLVAAAVFVFDPFFHYHKPWFGLKAVLTDKEYQCIGTLRTFDYDALIVGSSVTENNDNTWFDEDFGVTSIKAARSYGMTADLCYLMDVAWETHDLKYVFYNIDAAALASEPEVTFESSGCPMYLYDKNPINDVKYLWNKDVLLEKIPYMVAQSVIGDYEEGKSYNWAQWKQFGEADVFSHYYRMQDAHEMLPEDAYAGLCEQNLALITAQVEAHPDTQYVFFFPPYSMLWWDTIIRAGERDAYLYNLRMAAERLLQYENVSLYDFSSDEGWILNLNNYMDTAHFTAEINHAMEQLMAGHPLEDGRTPEMYRLTTDNYEAAFERLKTLTTETIPALLEQYEQEERFLYDQG